MHKFLVQGAVVDHISRDTLDHRLSNLRSVSYSENNQNRRKKARATSQYRGVSSKTRTGKWYASIQCKGKTHYLGTYLDEVEAARAYNKAAMELYENPTINDV